MADGDSAAASPTSASCAGVKTTYNRDLLMVSISRFYTNRASIQRILPIISSASRVSLRLVDWFVTNYAKKHNVVLVHMVDEHPVHFNVYDSYRAQLKAYSKQQFDPFRRRDRIDFYYDRNQYVETTIGQLNFFRWMLQNRLLDYIDERFDAIEAEMLKSPSTAQLTDTAGSSEVSDLNNNNHNNNHNNHDSAVNIMAATSKPPRTGSGKKKTPAACSNSNCSKDAGAAAAAAAARTPPRTVIFD